MINPNYPSTMPAGVLVRDPGRQRTTVQVGNELLPLATCWEWNCASPVTVPRLTTAEITALDNADQTVEQGMIVYDSTQKLFLGYDGVLDAFESLYGSFFHAAVSLDWVDIVEMYTAGIPIVNSPGAGKAIAPLMATFYFKNNAAVYQNGGPILLQYGTTPHGAGQNAFGGTIGAALITTAAAASQSLYCIEGQIASEENTSLCIANQTASFSLDGTANLIVEVYYQIINVT